MEFRRREIFTGKSFDVPTHIVRLDGKKTHGWQLRYGKWILFSDHSTDGTGADAALIAATAELARRITKLPAPNGIRSAVKVGKANDMPVGISGPVTRKREGYSAVQFYLQVNFPIPGGKPVNRSVYIATENTLTPEKYQAAFAKAVAIRETGVRKFKLAATKAKRKQAGFSSVATSSAA